VAADLAELFDALVGFEWDAGNSDKNWSRHAVSQAECEQVFSNLPLLLSMAGQGSGSELRYFALGRTDAARELTVVFTIRGVKVRGISARPMSRRERREYVNAQSARQGEEDNS
jgi:uncharacterized protein